MGYFDPTRIVDIQTAKMLNDMERSAKVDELYNKIKEKRDNARLERDEHARKQDINDEEKSELRGEICAYNDILSLMKSMFEVKDEK